MHYRQLYFWHSVCTDLNHKRYFFLKSRARAIAWVPRIWNVGTKTIQYHNSLKIQDFIGNFVGSMPQVWQSGIENPPRYSDLCKPQYVPWATRTPPTHHYPFCPVTRVCISPKNQYGSQAIRTTIFLSTALWFCHSFAKQNMCPKLCTRYHHSLCLNRRTPQSCTFSD